jgi:hypothetical protein
MSKKAGKSLKEKRAEKQAKAAAKNKTEIVPSAKKRRDSTLRTVPARTSA